MRQSKPSLARQKRKNRRQQPHGPSDGPLALTGAADEQICEDGGRGSAEPPVQLSLVHVGTPVPDIRQLDKAVPADSDILNPGMVAKYFDEATRGSTAAMGCSRMASRFAEQVEMVCKPGFPAQVGYGTHCQAMCRTGHSQEDIEQVG